MTCGGLACDCFEEQIDVEDDYGLESETLPGQLRQQLLQHVQRHRTHALRNLDGCRAPGGMVASRVQEVAAPSRQPELLGTAYFHQRFGGWRFHAKAEGRGVSSRAYRTPDESVPRWARMLVASRRPEQDPATPPIEVLEDACR